MNNDTRTDACSERNFLREFEAKRGMGACICEGQEITAALDEIELLRSRYRWLCNAHEHIRAMIDEWHREGSVDIAVNKDV